MATYKDIQRETGLSLATISKYFNNRNVLEDNRRVIEAAVQRLDFRPNAFARNLRSRRSRTIGVLLPVLNNEFHLTIIAGVEEALRRRRMSVIVASSPSPADDAVELLLGHMVDGIIAVTPQHDVTALRSATERVPVVMVDWDAGGIETDGVFLDNVGAGAMAARHLIDHGHRGIGLIAGDPAISTMRLRASGFRDELALDGVPLPDDAIRTGPLSIDFGTDATRALLRRHPRPTAIFCLNNELTVGALIAINESGLRLGRDISMIGFDGLEVSRVTVPRLTVIAQPTREIAARAAELIARRILEGERTGDVHTELLSALLVPGGSVVRLDAD